MEFAAFKRGKKRARRRKRLANKKQVKFSTKQGKHLRSVNSTFMKTQTVFTNEKVINNEMMGANAFWDNYAAAHEWQKRHNATWWKTRCLALEHENNLLKDVIRKLTLRNNGIEPSFSKTSIPQSHQNPMNQDLEDESFEFELNEDMMNFLTQSAKHKIELESKRNSAENETNKIDGDFNLEVGGRKWFQKRNDEAKRLYGDASPKILAMETALQTTIQRHKDKAKPQYWPNIALKL